MYVFRTIRLWLRYTHSSLRAARPLKTPGANWVMPLPSRLLRNQKTDVWLIYMHVHAWVVMHVSLNIWIHGHVMLLQIRIIPLGLVEYEKINSGRFAGWVVVFPVFPLFFLFFVACRQATAVSSYSTSPRGIMLGTFTVEHFKNMCTYMHIPVMQ